MDPNRHMTGISIVSIQWILLEAKHRLSESRGASGTQ
jgi:hypothetical protein